MIALTRSVAAALLVALSCAVRASGYDPLATGAVEPAVPLDLDVAAEDRQRTIPIRIVLPSPAVQSAGPAPVVLFSHGLGGSRAGCGYLGRHWAARGYAAVFLQHPGSDESVWKDVPPRRRLAAMRQAASAENLVDRLRDVAAVLDRLEEWSRADGHPLAGRLDPERAGMAGHSFGGMTTQAVGGQSLPLVGRRFADGRIKAAVVMSPSSPGGALDPGDAFSGVAIPWLLMTGTRDTALVGGQTVASRLAVFPALPAGGVAYELVLDAAEHSAFSERPLPGESGERNPNHHRAILAITTAFWDAFLAGDADARTWLDGPGPRGVLEDADRWRMK